MDHVKNLSSAEKSEKTSDKSSSEKLPPKDQDKKDQQEKQEALQFMCGIMDECTHLKNFSVPVCTIRYFSRLLSLIYSKLFFFIIFQVDTELIIVVTAKGDGYVPRDGLTDIREVWPGSEVRYLDAGHIGAYFLHQKVFR